MKNATTQMPYLKRAATEKPFLCLCLEATAAILLEGEAAPEAGIRTRVTRQSMEAHPKTPEKRLVYDRAGVAGETI